MTAPHDELVDEDGQGAAVWADLSVKLETTADAIKDQLDRWQKLYSSLHLVQITAPAITAGKVVDLPDILGPRLGWCWDVHRLTLAGGPGTVYVYKSLVSPTNLMDILTVPGSYRFGKTTWLVGEHERIVFQGGADLTGEAIAGGDASQFYAKCLPLYLT